ncbi:MAG: 3-isopropylmalate dehydrogenase, partial [Lachnospiraceae bacterium]|nr:3-isopropylmalate dehydrogenase [Lachnospiraceae bacterium]
YEAAMDLIIRANKETHKEAETRMLKDTLREIFADELVEERTEGKAEGKTGAVLLLLSEHGNIPEDLEKAVLREQNEDRLNEWVLLAAKVADSSDFARAAGIDLE